MSEALEGYTTPELTEVMERTFRDAAHKGVSGLRVVDSDKEQRYQILTGDNLGENDYKWNYAKK